MDGTWGVWVENKSDKDIYFVLGLERIGDYFYPITHLPSVDYGMALIESGRRRPVDYSAYERIKCSGDKPIAAFIFSPDSVAKYTWEELGVGEKYLKKYEYTCENLPGHHTNPIVYP
jgi:hypothetical protein